MRAKTAPARVKTKDESGADLPAGEFKALVSVFGTVDSVGDVVMPGAFSKSLGSLAEKGAPIPIVWSHDWNDPFSHIGVASSATETEAGLEIAGTLDIGDNPKALQVYKLLKGGRVRDFSFAYEVRDSGEATRDGKSVTELRELDIFEAGPTLVGAHRDTELLDIKAGTRNVRLAKDLPGDLKPGTEVETIHMVSQTELTELITEQVTEALSALGDAVKNQQPAGVKSGRVLSKANESRIKQIAELAQELLASVASEENNDDSKATPASPAAVQEPPAGAKTDPPAGHAAAANRLLLDLELMELEAETREESGT